MLFFQRQNRISLFNKHLRLLHSNTDSLVCYCYSRENPFFFLQDLGFFVPLLPDTPFVGASDIGQESAYMCKLPELPPGTSGSLHM